MSLMISQLNDLARLLPMCILVLFALATQATADDTSAPPEAVAHRDIVYATPAGTPLKLDLFTPPGHGPWPTVLWFHGGAWKMGDRISWPHMMFLLRRGYAVANVDYRLTGVAPYPAQMDDCTAALDFLRSHASDYGLDGRFAATGESAGGHLATMLGMTCGPGRVQAVIDMFGPTDLVGLAKLGDRWTQVMEAFAGGDLATHMDVLHAASPIDHVHPHMPPMLIFHGDKDPLVPIDQSRRFVDLLHKAGDPVEFITVEGAGHASPEFWTDAYRDRMAAFLDRKVKSMR